MKFHGIKVTVVTFLAIGQHVLETANQITTDNRGNGMAWVAVSSGPEKVLQAGYWAALRPADLEYYRSFGIHSN